MKGRQISDLVLIENKMTDAKLHSGEEGVIIKIAMKKLMINFTLASSIMLYTRFHPRSESLDSGCSSFLSFLY